MKFFRNTTSELQEPKIIVWTNFQQNGKTYEIRGNFYKNVQPLCV